MIRIVGLKKSFGQKVALDKVDLELASGEILGFLGPSGSGKSTTIGILTGQVDPDAGLVQVFDKDVKDLGAEDFAQMGLMSDALGFYETLTVYQNLTFFARFFQIPMKEVDALLKRLELWEERDVRASKLSTGMKQRMMLIRAVLYRPQLLFLDEPTSGLDPSLTRKIQDLLLELKEAGVGIFLTTHNMEEATRLCDRLVLLHKGRIVESGTLEEIRERQVPNEDLVTIRYRDGQSRVVPRAEVSQYFSDQVIGMDSTEMDLEAIFIKLTGASLHES
ncbi:MULTISPECIES: ABC transporter ATP-binding protein [unclassified Streptococcus]|uniref:ABC transporter ATP-binding protein n=1 Tax=unclassified Streptococcus TaxID=2608887 RepID=UPI0018CAAE56|nr:MULTISPECIES: ABC transporter ATP-binding protein [unclassified Streptococcus]MBG9366836.1 ABC transporter ATP-binding protein [Streptococcus sp. NLN64]MBJ6745908.1 ABC transporter ATP-binding protein [Streptococcus sp. 121]